MIANIILSKLALATFVIVLAEIFRRRSVRPQLCYAAWFAVIVILLAPPVISVPLLNRTAAAIGQEKMPAPAFKTSATLGSSDRPASLSTVERPAGSIGRPGAEASAFRLSELPWQAIGLSAWAIGTVCLLAHRGIRRRTLGRLVGAAETAGPTWQALCQELADELGIRDCPRVVTAKGAFSPFLWHPLTSKARIVFPQELLQSLSPESLEAIVRHELIHFRRRDTWRHHVEAFASAAWWWFPGVWLTRRRLREYEELCVDAQVLGSAPSGHRAYATALLDAYEFLFRPATREYAAAPAFARRRFLKTRIERIMGNQLGSANRSTTFAAGVVCLSLMSLGFLSFGQAQAEKVQAAKPAKGAPFTGEKRKEHRELPARSGGTLTFKSMTGSIKIVTHNQDTVIYDAEYKANKQSPALLDHVEFDYQAQNGDSQITVRWKDDRAPKGGGVSIGHVIAIPARYHIKVTTAGGSIAVANDLGGAAQVETSGGSVAMKSVKGNLAINTSGGSIAVNDVEGDAEIVTSGGSIKLDRVGGHLHTTTSGGSIVAVLANQITKPVEMETSGGSIALVAPKDLKAHLIAKTTGGTVACDFLNLKGKRKSIDAQINGGGPKLTLSTSGGSISLAQDKR